MKLALWTLVSTVAASAAPFSILSNQTSSPGYSLRVSQQDPKELNVDSVKQYTGYLDTQDKKHFFYWFFESRGDPTNDPVVLWLSGGPGCSSLGGLFYENGPSSVDENLKLVRNANSWNSNANVIYLDQPVGTGFSYSDGGQIDTSDGAAKDLYSFLTLFFEQFPQYNKGQKFHIASESYGGHYAPISALEIMSHKDKTFRLDSILVGNGIWDPLHQAAGFHPMACGQGGVPAVLNQTECDQMAHSFKDMQSEIQTCYDSKNPGDCSDAQGDFNYLFINPVGQKMVNVYDLTKKCDPEAKGLCYKAMNYPETWLNQDHVKQVLGVPTDMRFDTCNGAVNAQFQRKGDEIYPYVDDFHKLLDDYNLPVLVYAGDHDYICNWLGNYFWTNALDWSGKSGFNSAPYTFWKPNGKAVGEIKNYKHFTFLRVYDAGHMVPHDQPEVSLAMLNKWIQGNYAL